MGGCESGGQGHAEGVTSRCVHRDVSRRDDGRSRRRALDLRIRALLARGRTADYRLQNEFRELWPEYETPNELARLVIRHVDDKLSKRDIATLPARLMVTV